jgi:hypothetical protein
MLQAHWVAWMSPLLERIRRDPRVLAVMQPLLGPDIRQVAQQIHWKPPGVAQRTGYRFHQDLRFRERREAFRGGESIPLGSEPEICKYEALREKPGPFYDENKWFESADGS